MPTDLESSGNLIADLQVQVTVLNSEINELKSANDRLSQTNTRCESEKKDAIAGVMERMQESFTEQDDLRSELSVLQEELKKRDLNILKLQEQAQLDKEKMREEITANVSMELRTQVHDLQRLMEETGKEKEAALVRGTAKESKLEEEKSSLQESMDSLKEEMAKDKEVISKMARDKDDLEKKLAKTSEKLNQEQVKLEEMVGTHNKQLKDKQTEHQQQLNRTKQQATHKLNEANEQHKKEMDAKVKELESQQQQEVTKQTRKSETKVNELKKIVKDLRAKVKAAESQGEEEKMKQ